MLSQNLWDRLAPGTRCLTLASGETQTNPGQEQTLVQSLVGVTVESAPKSRGRTLLASEHQGDGEMCVKRLGFRQCWLLLLHLMRDLGAGRIYLSVRLLALRQGLV